MNNIENRTTKGYFLTNYKTIEVERLEVARTERSLNEIVLPSNSKC